MQRHGFEMHDIFCSTPGNLARELDTFHAVAGEVNEAVGMPHRTLFSCLCLKSNNHIFLVSDPAKENIRYCRFFIQVLQDSWGPVGLFRELYDVAISCLLDQSAPMQGVAVFVKPPASVEIPAGATVYHYETIESFEAQLLGLLTDWLNAAVSPAS